MSPTINPLPAILLVLGSVFALPLLAQVQHPPTDPAPPANQVAPANADAPKPTPQKIVIYPRKQGDRPLEHRLFPTLKEMINEDAAGYYLKAMIIRSDRYEVNKQDERVVDLLEALPEKFDLIEARQILENQSNTLKHLHYAAKRKNCNWPLPWREEHLNIYGLLLPEVQQMRNLIRLLRLEARVALAEGRLTDALASIQTGYVAARHISTAPFMINGLVGVAIASMMHEELLLVMQHPACPNLYWSLTALPQPLLDFRPSMEFEGNILTVMFPEWDQLDQPRTRSEWNQLYINTVVRLIEMFENLSISMKPGSVAGEFDPASLLSKPLMMAAITPYLHSQAKVGLAKRGYDKKTIDAMPMSQAILLEIVRSYQHHRDEILKWQYLPANERPSLQAMMQKEREIQDSGLLNYASGLLPSMRAVSMSFLRLDRRTNFLRAVEALRMHAAETGRLPQQWKEVTIVPVPRDPLTGEPFRYQLRGETALLEALEPEESFGQLSKQYEIRLAKPGEVYVQPRTPTPLGVAVKSAPRTGRFAWTDYINPFGSLRQRAEIIQSLNNLKQMVLAMHNYLDVNKHLPPAATVDPKTGKPLLSWRVHLLPYLEEDSLYKEFHLDEPWDSPHNKALLDKVKMPAIFASPLRPNLPKNHTAYLLATGDKTMFHGPTGLSLARANDGTSKTILGFEAPAALAVPWTKPDDWAYDPQAKEPLANFFAAGANEVLTMFADGSARVIPRTTEPAVIEAALTAAGGEIIDEQAIIVESRKNLKVLALALQNYHDAKQHFPPAATVDAKTGKPLLSWRVQLLPFLGQQQLYDQFHLDEPWDSPHNKALLDKMPAVFASLRRPNLPKNHTAYLVPTGKSTIFRDASGMKMQQIADGTAKTILGFEAPAALAVPWTKPDDWAFDPDAKDSLLNFFAISGDALVVLVDGSTHVIPRETRPEAVKAALTAAVGENESSPFVD